MAMTAQQMVEEVWERVGEPSDLDPFQADGVTISTGSAGWLRTLRALNQGITAVASWRDPQSGRQFRFRNRHAWQYVSHSVSTSTLTADAAKGATTLAFGASGTADARIDYVVKVGTEVRLVTDDDGAGVHTLNKSLDSAHSTGDEVEFAPRFVTIDTTTNKFVEVASVYNTELGVDVLPGDRGDVFTGRMTSAGDPRKWFRVGDRIYFDMVRVDEAQQFRVDYLRLPGDMVAVDDTSGLPEAFDEPVIMWTVGWGFGRILDPVNRAAARSEFTALMRSRQNEWHVSDEHNMELGGYVREDY